MIDGVAQLAVVKNIDSAETIDPARLLELPEDFLQEAPDFVLDLSERGHPPSGSWGQSRQRHGSSLRHVKSALLFGASHIIAPDGSCSSDVQNFRREALNVVNGPTFNHFFPGTRPEVRFEGKDAIVDTSKLSEADVTHLSMPVFVATTLEPDNYGRWLVQILPRLAYYGMMSSRYGLLVRARHQWQRLLLRFCGVSEDRIVNHNPGAVYFCDEIASISHTAGDFTVSRRDMTVFRHISLECCAVSSSQNRKRIYISRKTNSERNPHYRVLLNELSLIAELQKLDFAIIEPELLSFAEQVAVFSQAEFIVGLGGAAMFNVVFCSDACRIVDIESSAFYITSHTGIFSSRGLRHGVIFGSPVEDRINANWTLNVDEAIQAIKAYL